jgi:hypothetical protein
MKRLCLSIVMTLLLAGIARTQGVTTSTIKIRHPSSISPHDLRTQLTQ